MDTVVVVEKKIRNYLKIMPWLPKTHIGNSYWTYSCISPNATASQNSY